MTEQKFTPNLQEIAPSQKYSLDKKTSNVSLPEDFIARCYIHILYILQIVATVSSSASFISTIAFDTS